MSREGTIALICSAGGILLLLAGLFVPAHYRAVDWEVLRVAGEGTPSRVALGHEYLLKGQAGPAARLFQGVLNAERTPDAPEAGDGAAAAAAGLEQVDAMVAGDGGVGLWGATNPWLDACCGEWVRAFTGTEGAAGVEEGRMGVGVPVLEWLLPAQARQAVLKQIQGSTDPAVMALLGVRKVEQTVILPAVSSASGQPLDAGLLLAAAMVEQQRGKAGVSLDLERGAMAATQGRGSEAVETLVLDLLAAARFLDWEQLGALLDRCEDAESLHRLVAASGGEDGRWTSLFTLVTASGGARQLGEYVAKRGEAGLKDLERTMELGAGALTALLKAGDRIHEGRWRGRLVRSLGAGAASRWVSAATSRTPTLALAVRYLLWLDGVFLLVLGLWWGRRLFLAETNRRFQPRPDLVSVGVVAVTAVVGLFLASERFLGLNAGAAAGRAASGLPVLKARVRFDLPPATNSLMNEKVIGMLVLFFVTQFAIYLIGLSRLRHIRGQGVSGGVKLRLLDNEESMFDAPLYLGIAGSVLALVLRLTGFGDVSLMASYSSTLFGILFCFVLKVMHVRPYRQQLILESSELTDS